MCNTLHRGVHLSLCRKWTALSTQFCKDFREAHTVKSFIIVNVIFYTFTSSKKHGWLCTVSVCLWCNINGKMRHCLLSRVLERQRQDQTSLSWRQKGLQLRDVWSWGTGGTGTVPLFNLLLGDTGFLAGSHWEGAGSKRECNLRMEAADFRLPFRQPLLGVVWCDHQ